MNQLKDIMNTKESTKIKVCPRCGKEYKEYPALSRHDNKTKICPACGIFEALEDFYGSPYKGEKYWEE